MNTTDQTIRNYDRLEKLLEQQIEFARKGNIRNIEKLVNQAQILINQLEKNSHPDQPELKKRREKLSRLYKTLCLTLTSQKKDVSQKLEQVRKGRKTLNAYQKGV